MSAFSRQIWVLLLVTVSVVVLIAVAIELGNGANKRTAEKSASTRDESRNTAKPKAQTKSTKSDSFTDKRDGKTYRTVKIGNQMWMAENMNYQTSRGSWCYGNNNSNCDKYGRLYDWNTAMIVCPSGWRLPSNQEWGNLVAIVGGIEIAGKKLKSQSGWNDSMGKNGNGTDDYGFSALPGGSNECYGDCGFDNIGNHGEWWTTTEADGFSAYSRSIDRGDKVYESDNSYGIRAVGKDYGYSVRCIQN